MVWDLLLAGFLGWVGSNIWEKHGGKVAERFPIVEKLGLAESPPTVKRREAKVSPSSGNTRSEDE